MTDVVFAGPDTPGAWGAFLSAIAAPGTGGRGAALSPLSARVTGEVLAVLALEYPVPVSTRTVEARTGYGPRYGQAAYRMLCRLERRGVVEKTSVPDSKSRYWRLAVAPWAMPDPDAGCGDAR